MGNIMEEKTVSYEEMAGLAELKAEADDAVSSAREVTDEDIKTGKEDDADSEDEESKYKVEFFKEYDFYDGTELKKIKSIDLSGLLDLTTIDGEKFDRILIRLNHRPQNKFTDVTYCKHVAAHVTNMPIEFFNILGIRDMLLIVGAIHNYFLYGYIQMMIGL